MDGSAPERPGKRDRDAFAAAHENAPAAASAAAIAATDRFGTGFLAAGRDEHPRTAVIRACELASVRLGAAEAIEALMRRPFPAGRPRRPDRHGRFRGIDTRRTKSGRAAAQQGVAMGIQGMLARFQMKQMLAERGQGVAQLASTESGAAREAVSAAVVDPLLPCGGPDIDLSKEVKKLCRDLDRAEAWQIATAVAEAMTAAAGRVRAAAEAGAAELAALGDGWSDGDVGIEVVDPAPAALEGSPVGGGEGWVLLRYAPEAGSDAASLLEACTAQGGRWAGSARDSASRGSQWASLRGEDLHRAVARANPTVGFGEPEDMVAADGTGRPALAFRVRAESLAKLRTLYGLHCGDADPSGKRFVTRAFAVIARYEALARTTSGSQGAVTHATFDWLVAAHGADAECFASPLNCYLPRYCSAFPDCDAFFGSLGSFFDLDVASLGGTWECNPPFTSDMMLACMRRCVDACRARDEAGSPDAVPPLTFVVFTPAWTDDAYVIGARCSGCCTAEVRVSRSDHQYRDGMQHAASRAVWRANVDSLVFVMQCREARRRWLARFGDGTGREFADDLLTAMRRKEDGASALLCPALVPSSAE